MKKQVLFILCIVALFIAQAKPPAYVLKEPEPGLPLHAEFLVKGKSVDQMVSKVNGVLTIMGWKVLSDSKGTGHLTPLYSLDAVKYPSADPNKRQGLFIDMDMEGASLKLTADWYLVAQEPQRPKAQAKSFYDEFFRQLAEALK